MIADFESKQPLYAAMVPADNSPRVPLGNQTNACYRRSLRDLRVSLHYLQLRGHGGY
jgi:hypothetical protein